MLAIFPAVLRTLSHEDSRVLPDHNVQAFLRATIETTMINPVIQNALLFLSPYIIILD